MYTPRSTDSDYLKLKRQVKKLMTRKPLGWTSVSDGQTQFRGEDSVNIIGSGLVEGLLRIVGQLLVSGSAQVTGDLTIGGNTEITGETTLHATLTVDSAGKIVIQGSIPVTLGVTSEGVPGMQFDGGARVVGVAQGVAIKSPSGTTGIGVSDASIAMSNGTSFLTIGAPGVSVTGPFNVNGAMNLANVPISDPHVLGSIWRSGSDLKISLG